MKKFVCDMAVILTALGAMAAIGALIEQSVQAPVAVSILAICIAAATIFYRLGQGGSLRRPAVRRRAAGLQVNGHRKAKSNLRAA